VFFKIINMGKVLSVKGYGKMIFKGTDHAERSTEIGSKEKKTNKKT